MARGAESKPVAEKQERASPSPKNASEEEAALIFRRRKLELSRKDVERRLETAQAKPHREMLRRALAALDEELASLG
ncbi:MAG: hypothetical protein LJF15_15285 [Acidobacteria bacterium]|jgi:hypothetical protein|nr:hypothetical protein [Acidobacteriota bacterium]